jgi:colanic acid/amylovoran biosynthesis glycosyltransferase
MVKKLAIIPSVPIWSDGDSLVFDRKFYDGMLVYKNEWPGDLICVMRKSNSLLPDFGTIAKETSELPFKLITIAENEKINYSHIKDASIVLATGDDYQQLHVSAICKQHQIKCVYIIENIPETRRQILNLEEINPIIKLRRHFFLWQTEKQRVKAFRLAEGLQANGNAAHDEYGWHSNNHLYFDTRVNRELIITDDALANRLSSLLQSRPLHLAFSGRLIKMKGADHLIPFAIKLRDQTIDFRMTIYGSGDLENQMKTEIKSANLEDNVKMAGAVDFYDKLLPEIKASVDIYIILHRQSDPSCTYLETLSCGIPIVGYTNRAFSGLLKMADVGWGKPIDDFSGIASTVAYLNNDRNEISKKSICSAKFACLHDFESTFRKRINHLIEMVK